MSEVAIGETVARFRRSRRSLTYHPKQRRTSRKAIQLMKQIGIAFIGGPPNMVDGKRYSLRRQTVGRLAALGLHRKLLHDPGEGRTL
jgi:hypothetical protein